MFTNDKRDFYTNYIFFTKQTKFGDTFEQNFLYPLLKSHSHTQSPESSSDFARALWRFINHELPGPSLSLGRKLRGFFRLDGWILEVCNTRSWLRWWARRASLRWSRVVYEIFMETKCSTPVRTRVGRHALPPAINRIIKCRAIIIVSPIFPFLSLSLFPPLKCS